MGVRWLGSWLRVEIAYQCYWRWTRYRRIAQDRAVDRDPIVRWIARLKDMR